MKKLVIGILAHVDAGKTTLAESMLYKTGSIRKLGRVDHKDAFLDTNELERARGITIFSKQAVILLNDMEVTLLDTPGHVDFSAEMERTLQVLDYAVLVISGSDGVQGHTQTLWRLLARYGIPTFLFINKMDLSGTDRNALLAELKKRLNEGCVDFCEDQSSTEFLENLAVCDETLLDKYMEYGAISEAEVAHCISERKIFPCYFGSALKLHGIENFLRGINQYTQTKPYSDQFGAKIFKITRDEQGNRLTHLKVTGGSLKIKMLLTNRYEQSFVDETAIWEDKVDQIRIYSGTRYDTVDEARAGTVCTVTGLDRTYPGEGLGIEAVSDMPILEPILNYQVILPSECDANSILIKLRQLEEEDPQLHIVWSEQLKEIHLQLMGEVQIEVLKNIISERFGVNVEFGTGNIVYKETILEPVVGIGHFEPLRHYAEVHLLMEPDEAGSGLTFTSNCSEDELSRNWQRLILTHLEEKDHVGVLTGSPITDMKITLIAGRAHQKHTEGGDFRQATYRAVRQGLKKSRNVLLEPYYNFRLEIPSDTLGRAMSDIQRMSGSFNPPELLGEMSVLTGNAPVATMRGYMTEVNAYTRGKGRLFCELKGYQPCHNATDVIEAIGYDSERDISNPSASVFCAHGAGFVVEWDKVEDYMHVDNGWQEQELEGIKDNLQYNTKDNQMYYLNDDSKNNPKDGTADGTKDGLKGDSEEASKSGFQGAAKVGDRNNPMKIDRKPALSNTLQEDKELEDIFIRTFGPMKHKLPYSPNGLGYEKKATTPKPPVKQPMALQRKEQEKEYLLVDGYNIIFSWEELSELARENMDAARGKLMDILCNYQGYTKCILILVFDAYKVKGGIGEVREYHNIHVVYTKEAETADQYIEKATHEIAREHRVTVATSDALEQLIIMGKGAARMSANDLKEEIIRIGNQIRSDYLERHNSGRAYLKDQFSDYILEFFKEIEND